MMERRFRYKGTLVYLCKGLYVTEPSGIWKNGRSEVYGIDARIRPCGSTL